MISRRKNQPPNTARSKSDFTGRWPFEPLPGLLLSTWDASSFTGWSQNRYCKQRNWYVSMKRLTFDNSRVVFQEFEKAAWVVLNLWHPVGETKNCGNDDLVHVSGGGCSITTLSAEPRQSMSFGCFFKLHKKRCSTCQGPKFIHEMTATNG